MKYFGSLRNEILLHYNAVSCYPQFEDKFGSIVLECVKF
jgi:hypothetical protein